MKIAKLHHEIPNWEIPNWSVKRLVSALVFSVVIGEAISHLVIHAEIPLPNLGEAALDSALLLVLLLPSLYIFVFRPLTTQIAERKQAEQALREASIRMSHLIAASSTLLFSMRVVGEKLHTDWVSDNLGNLLGYTKDEVMQPDWWLKYLHPQDRGRVVAASAELFNGKPVALDYRFQHKAGHDVWIHDEQKLVCDKEGKPVEVVSSWSDVTGHKMVELELRVAAVTFDSHEGIMITDANKIIQRVNKAFTQMTGYTPHDVIGQKPTTISSGRQDKTFYQNIWLAIEHRDYWQGEIWNRRKNGEVYPEHLTITAVKDKEGTITNYVGTFYDITLGKAAENEIKDLAFYDPLTRLPNRRLLVDRLNQTISASKRSGSYSAMMFLDLDNFKPLNDAHGHVVGDLLLLEVASRLKACVREMDTVARFGGDEFVVILSELDADKAGSISQAGTVAEKIRTTLSAPYLLTTTHETGATTVEHRCTASIGVVLFIGHEATQESLLKRADMAMYQAKESGRDFVCFFD